MTQYVLQTLDSTKQLIKSYEITDEFPEPTKIPAGRKQVIITDGVKFAKAVAIGEKHNIDTHAYGFVDFTTLEPVATTQSRFIATTTGIGEKTGFEFTAGYIYNWDEANWVETIPENNEKRFVHCLNAIYNYTGSEWVESSGPLPKLEYVIADNDITWEIV